MTLWCCSRPTFRAQCCAPASGTSALSLMGNCLRWKELPPPRLHPPMASLGGLDQVFQSLVHLLPAGTMLECFPPQLQSCPWEGLRPPRGPLCRSVSLSPKSSFLSTSQVYLLRARH